MVHSRLPWLNVPGFFGFIRAKTMAFFVRKLRENIRCVVGGETITNIKTRY